MQWVRARRKVGGLSALLGLALQLALSFGHFPAEEIFFGRGTTGDVPICHGGGEQADQAQPNGADRQSAPWKSTHNNNYCAICAAMNLLRASFVPEAPHPLPPGLVARAVEHSDRVAAAFFAARRGPFQSRAPPIA
jgi:hypothetical protein